MVFLKGRDLRSGKVEINMKEISIREREMELEFAFSIMESHTLVNG